MANKALMMTLMRKGINVILEATRQDNLLNSNTLTLINVFTQDIHRDITALGPNSVASNSVRL